MFRQNLFVFCGWDVVVLIAAAVMVCCYLIKRKKLKKEEREYKNRLARIYTSDIMRTFFPVIMTGLLTAMLVLGAGTSACAEEEMYQGKDDPYVQVIELAEVEDAQVPLGNISLEETERHCYVHFLILGATACIGVLMLGDIWKRNHRVKEMQQEWENLKRDI